MSDTRKARSERNRSRPMTYDDSCWGCILDDHLYEEEDDEIAKIIGEEPPKEAPGFMGMFLLYAAPTVSEEEEQAIDEIAQDYA